MKKAFLSVLLMVAVCFAATPTGLTATHQNGQTFLVWDDVSGAGEYYIYRSTSEFSTSDLTAANRVGVIESGSSEMTPWATGSRNIATAVGSDYYRISDLGSPLTSGDELFVWTTQESGGGSFYYAVTAVDGSSEDATAASGNTAGPVSESECTMIHPVEQWRSTDSTGRVYMMWMPFDKWNTFLEGYTHPFYVAGTSFDKKRLHVSLHAMDCEYENWLSSRGPMPASQVVGSNNYHILFVDDPRNTWHYGYADSLLGTPSNFGCLTSATVKNFTEYRYWCSIRWLCSSASPFPSDTDEVTIGGGSMGGSGAMTFSIHHPDIFAYVRTSSIGINDWGSLTKWPNDEADAFGYGKAIDCVDLIDKNALIANRDVGMTAREWMSCRESVLPVISANDRDVCFYSFAHGTQDNTIQWTTQGMPIYSDNESNAFAEKFIPYSAGWVDVGHGSTGTAGRNESGYVPRSHFVLALKASESDDELKSACLTSTCNDDGQINARVLWSKLTDAQNTAVETPETLETTITLETASLNGVSYSGPSDPTVDITPRRLNTLIHTPGTIYNWKNIASGGSTIADGQVTADEHGIFTIEDFEFSANGNRLQVIVDTPGQVNFHDHLNQTGMNRVTVSSILKPGAAVVFRNEAGKNPDRISVYAVDGRRLDIQSVNGKLIWPSKEMDGRSVSSGIYVLNGVFGNRTISRRAVFIK